MTLGSLLCGSCASECAADLALTQLSQSLDNFARRAIGFFQQQVTDDTITFGPFCARVILENSCAALVGRFDSFRILYLSEFQAQEEYDLSKRAKSAFSWTGDVIPVERQITGLWNVEHDLPKISRALFSAHSEHVYWKPAVEKLLEFVSMRIPDTDLTDILRLEPDSFIPQIRGQSVRLYSTLSKGVHWEFFTSVLSLDEASVKDQIRDTILLVANLGLVSHFVPTAYSRLDGNRAIEIYKELRGAVT